MYIRYRMDDEGELKYRIHANEDVIRVLGRTNKAGKKFNF